MAVSFHRSDAITTDGSGDGTTTAWRSYFNGELVGLRYVFSGSTAATADTTLSEQNGLARTIDSVADSATNITKNPANAVLGATDAFTPYYVDSANLTLTIAQGGATVADAVYIIVMIKE